MKVKCPHSKNHKIGDSCSWVCGPFVAGKCEADIEIPTADLITELETRRPCKSCVHTHYAVNSGCGSCVYRSHVLKFNFKATK